MIVNGYLAKAEKGDPEALVKARNYMAANGGPDWTEHRDRAAAIEERLLAAQEVP